MDFFRSGRIGLHLVRSWGSSSSVFASRCCQPTSHFSRCLSIQSNRPQQHQQHQQLQQHQNASVSESTTITVNDDDDHAWISKQNRTLPNLITFSRILASPGLTYAVVHDMKGWALGGCLLFGFSDWLDGYIARNFNQASTLGSYLDPVADKVMIGSLSLGLMWHDLLPGELVALIIGRDVFLLSMSCLIRAIDKPPNAPFFEVTKTITFEVKPSELSKVLMD
jgi:cardiolipin synthase (CMP-forming)